MVDTYAAARAELDDIQMGLTFLDSIPLVKRRKRGELYVTIPDRGIVRHEDVIKMWRVAQRKWLRKWGAKLKTAGYLVSVSEQPLLEFSEPHLMDRTRMVTQTIGAPFLDISELPAKEAKPIDPWDVSEFLENEKSK